MRYITSMLIPIVFTLDKHILHSFEITKTM
jgi:hypothetical protein